MLNFVPVLIQVHKVLLEIFNSTNCNNLKLFTIAMILWQDNYLNINIIYFERKISEGKKYSP